MKKKLTIDGIGKELLRWRKTRAKMGPIPTPLRFKIGQLRSEYSDSIIARALGLTTTQVKKFSQLPNPMSEKLKTPRKDKNFLNVVEPMPEFIRVAPIASRGNTGMITELKRADGVALQCVVASSDIKTFMEAFLCSQ
jgi:hypothetical protein